MRAIFLISILSAFSFTTFSQDCASYYYLQNNKTIEMTVYNKKGDANGKQVLQISDVKKNGNTTTATVNSEFFDKKGRSAVKGVNTIKCSGGILMMDMKMFMGPQQQGQGLESDAKASDIYLSYPANMKTGDALPDGDFNMEVKQNTGVTSKVEMKITNRKVQGQESITTPAGTWKSFKITYHMEMKISMMGIGIPMKDDVTEWFAPGFGVVKTESKMGKTEITSVK